MNLKKWCYRKTYSKQQQSIAIDNKWLKNLFVSNLLVLNFYKMWIHYKICT